MPQFEAMLERVYSQCFHDGGEEEPLQNLRHRAEQRDRAVGATLLTGPPSFKYWDNDGVLPNCRDVNSGKWEVEESARKFMPCSPRWRRWSTVSPSGRWAVEELAFLMAAATPCSHVELPV